MNGILEKYAKKDGSVGLRIRFPAWPLPSGRTVYHVSIFPHLCSTDVCMEGDHVHVDTYDTRKTLDALRSDILLSPAQELEITRLLEAQVTLNSMAIELAELLPQEVA